MGLYMTIPMSTALLETLTSVVFPLHKLLSGEDKTYGN